MSPPSRPKLVIVGAGFGGMKLAQILGSQEGVEITILDRRNHHLFQPLLYQVAMAGLSPAEIASPIRSLLHRHRNIRVLQAEVTGVDRLAQTVQSSAGDFTYDRLVVATGAETHYFGHKDWETVAPGLKSLSDATEIRARVLSAFERAETTEDPETRNKLMTFVIVGGGPTGVELAGAIVDMARFTLTRDFRRIDPKAARVVLIEAGSRILSAFDPALSAQAEQDLRQMGVEVYCNQPVQDIDQYAVHCEGQTIMTRTVIWAAGVKASALGQALKTELDRGGRVLVTPAMHLVEDPKVFVIGDLARVLDKNGTPLPALAAVAKQQGEHLGRELRRQIRTQGHFDDSVAPFVYNDQGIMATIGRRRAVVQSPFGHFSGYWAWMFWMGVHIYILNGFHNRLFVFMQWAYSYLTFHRGARLIVEHTLTKVGDEGLPSRREMKKTAGGDSERVLSK